MQGIARQQGPLEISEVYVGQILLRNMTFGTIAGDKGAFTVLIDQNGAAYLIPRRVVSCGRKTSICSAASPSSATFAKGPVLIDPP